MGAKPLLYSFYVTLMVSTNIIHIAMPTHTLSVGHKQPEPTRTRSHTHTNTHARTQAHRPTHLQTREHTRIQTFQLD